VNISPARLERPSSPARALRPQASKPYSPIPSLTILKTEPREGLKSLWLKVKTFFLNLVAQWFGGKSAAASPTTGPEVSAKAALTADQPLPLPKEIEVASNSGLISLPDKLVAVKRLKNEIQKLAGDINRILRRLEDYALTRGNLQGLKIPSFFEKNKIVINIEQLKAEIDQVSAQINTQNTSKLISKMLSMIHKSLLVVEKRIGKQNDPPKPTPKNLEEVLPKPMPIILSPTRTVEPQPSDFDPERVEVTTIVETPLTPEEMERMRFEQSIIGKQTEKIAYKLASSFPRLANSFKEAVFKLYRHQIIDIELSLGRLQSQIGELAEKKIGKYEVFGLVHEILRLGALSESREGKDRLTGIGQNLGEITFYMPEITEYAPGKFNIVGSRRKATLSLEADGYCRKSGTLIEIKYCENLRWFRDGVITAEERAQVFRIASQFRKYKKALDDGVIRAVEFHFTVSSLHPAAMKVIKETFQTQLPKVKIYLYPNNITKQISSKAELIFSGADITAIKKVA